jgi:opacity protein-like surface antigen
MFTKTKMAVAAALVLGLASAAQAGGRDDADSSGGYGVGPTGQSFNGASSAPRAEFFGQSENAYGYARVSRPSRSRKHLHNR